MRRGSFFFPGPTEVRPDVLQSMQRQPIPHRSAEFRDLFADAQLGLQELFRTNRAVLVATASGTGMMESAVRCAPAGRLLALVNGAFAERFVIIARACNREVASHEIPWGDVPDPGELRQLLARDTYSAVTVVHSETSTGALSDIRTIAGVAREAGVAVIVDSVSGVGGAQVETSGWGLDCVISASQKALALPPGLAFATTSESFLRASEDVPDRGLYFDLRDYDAHARNDETPSTPAVSLIFALAHQMRTIREEGTEARWSRHENMRVAMEDWVGRTADSLGIGLGIVAREGARSPTVTVVSIPPAISAAALVAEVARRGFTIGSGYGRMRDTSFRVGHMGDHTTANLMDCLAAVEDALETLAARTSGRG